MLSRPIWLRYKKLTLSRGKDDERAQMRSTCGLGGHEWIDAVPSRPEFRLPAVLFLPAFRHYLGLDTWFGDDTPLQCRHIVPAGASASSAAPSRGVPSSWTAASQIRRGAHTHQPNPGGQDLGVTAQAAHEKRVSSILLYTNTISKLEWLCLN